MAASKRHLDERRGILVRLFQLFSGSNYEPSNYRLPDLQIHRGCENR